MEKTAVKKVVLYICFCLFILGSLFIWQYTAFYDGKLHIVFCDVGQGDGIVIRTPEKKTLVIDGGGDTRFLDCLSSKMPFWERRIHVALLTHPHADHYQGLIPLLRRYDVAAFATEDLINTTQGFTTLTEELQKQKLITKLLFSGDRITVGSDVSLSILGPTKSYLQQTSPQKKVGETGEFASLITNLSYKNFAVLFTGDSQASGIQAAHKSGDIGVLHVPHHGSRTGLTREILKKLSPEVAIISVGKNNYGHPSPEIISLLESEGIQIYRTDKKGDTEIVVDEEKWWIETEK